MKRPSIPLLGLFLPIPHKGPRGHKYSRRDQESISAASKNPCQLFAPRWLLLKAPSGKNTYLTKASQPAILKLFNPDQIASKVEVASGVSSSSIGIGLSICYHMKSDVKAGKSLTEQPNRQLRLTCTRTCAPRVPLSSRTSPSCRSTINVCCFPTPRDLPQGEVAMPLAISIAVFQRCLTILHHHVGKETYSWR